MTKRKIYLMSKWFLSVFVATAAAAETPKPAITGDILLERSTQQADMRVWCIGYVRGISDVLNWNRAACIPTGINAKDLAGHVAPQIHIHSELTFVDFKWSRVKMKASMRSHPRMLLKGGGLSTPFQRTALRRQFWRRRRGCQRPAFFS